MLFCCDYDAWATNSGGVYRICKTTGSAAVSLSCNPQDQARIVSVSIRFASAPTTSEYLTITLNSNQGSDYDAVLFRVDPSVTSATSIVWNPCFASLISGDSIDIFYANTDKVKFGIVVYYEI
jgi:hypothetical protein